jgi:enterochelin esterase-like enzyme
MSHDSQSLPDATALPPNAAIAAHLQQLLPGITPDEALRFSRHLACAEPDVLGPDSLPRDGVPQGALRAGQCAPGRIYPGVAHDYRVYVPAQYRADEPAALLVCLDGARYLGPEAQVATVLDNLIAAGELPPVVAVFVEPGAGGPGLPIYGGSDNRSVEYDTPGDAFARFLLDELLPVATDGLALRSDPAWRAICGLSSGGHAALNLAFERPDAFGRVISHCGSFVALRGGHLLHATLRQSARKPLRVFLQTGAHDLDVVFGDWQLANRQLASALAYRGYEHRLVVGRGGHSLRHGGAIFPDTLRWIWSPA